MLKSQRGLGSREVSRHVPTGEPTCITFRNRSPRDPWASSTRAVQNVSGSRRISASRSRRSSPAHGATADTHGSNPLTNAWLIRAGWTSSSYYGRLREDVLQDPARSCGARAARGPSTCVVRLVRDVGVPVWAGDDDALPALPAAVRGGRRRLTVGQFAPRRPISSNVPGLGLVAP